MRGRGVMLLVTAMLAGVAAAQTLDGTYLATDADESVTMTLKQGPDGTVTDSMVDATTTVRLSARLNGHRLDRTLSMDSEEVPFVATVEGADIVFDLSAGGETERIAFKRTDAPRPSPGASPESTAAPHGGDIDSYGQ